MKHPYNEKEILEDYNFNTSIPMNICFTANAIAFLSSSNMTINLSEWVWHEEVINGCIHHIITDRIIAGSND